MTPVITEFTSHILTAEGCKPLPITKLDGKLISLWLPSPEEREAIANGGPVFLIIYSETHPPVVLTAEPSAAGSALTIEL